MNGLIDWVFAQLLAFGQRAFTWFCGDPYDPEVDG